MRIEHSHSSQGQRLLGPYSNGSVKLFYTLNKWGMWWLSMSSLLHVHWSVWKLPTCKFQNNIFKSNWMPECCFCSLWPLIQSSSHGTLSLLFQCIHFQAAICQKICQIWCNILAFLLHSYWSRICGACWTRPYSLTHSKWILTFFIDLYPNTNKKQVALDIWTYNPISCRQTSSKYFSLPSSAHGRGTWEDKWLYKKRQRWRMYKPLLNIYFHFPSRPWFTF